MTINDLICYAKENNINKDFEIEAIYFILEEYFNLSKLDLSLIKNEELDIDKFNEAKVLIDKYIKDSIPCQYIMGKAYFYGNEYYVDSNVLIPRFDTEVVVDKAISEIDKLKKDKLTICDIGTGSGIIAISIKMKYENAQVYGIDISPDALMVSKKNAKKYNLDINFIENDLLSGIDLKFDIILSNPPYIKEDDYVMDLVKNNEPHIALFASDEGLYYYKRIIEQSIYNLKDDGVIVFEISNEVSKSLLEYASKYYSAICIYKDYARNDRVMVLKGKRDGRECI